MRTVRIGDAQVGAIGIGLWSMGASRRRERELEAVGRGLEGGMQVLDTAEMYGDGVSESFVGECVRRFGRDRLFVIDKVLPSNATPERLRQRLETALRLTGTDRLDLYLLHWRENADLAYVAQAMHDFVAEGLIARWGVSNFDVADLEDLWKVPYGDECAVNEDLYNVAVRGVDYDLLPWQREHHLPLIAYSPLGSGGMAGLEEMRSSRALEQVARRHGVSVQQVELAWAVRSGSVIAIPQTSNPDHMAANAAAGDLVLDEEDLALIDTDFPTPTHKIPLAKI
jgi:diketogulonate reductase-like aldo/keto reductase